MSRQHSTASFRKRSATYKPTEKQLPPLPSPYELDNAQYTTTLCSSPIEMDRTLSDVTLTPRTDGYDNSRRFTSSSRATLRGSTDDNKTRPSRGPSIIAFRPPIASSRLNLRIFSGDRKRAGSVDSNRTLVNDKLTHRWPMPASKATKERQRHRADDGQGLGMDNVRAWPKMKWFLLFSVLTVMAYGSYAMFVSLATWFRTWTHADVMYVADHDILVLISFAGSILLFTSIVGLTGIIVNSRPILAIYNLLLWPALMSMLAIGYASYKRSSFALDHKISFFWSQFFTPLGRLLIQNSLHCCGFLSPLHEAVPSRRCYPRTALPGCRGKLYRFERLHLKTIWQTTFALVAVHLLNIAIALLCSNHVTEMFGKGIMPRKYRLTKGDLKADKEKLEGMIMRRPEYSRAPSSLTFREDRKRTNGWDYMC